MALRDVLTGKKFTGGSTGSGTDPALRSRILDEYERIGIGWIWATDRDGKVSFLSETAIASLDNEADEIIGQAIETFWEVASIAAGGRIDGVASPLDQATLWAFA